MHYQSTTYSELLLEITPPETGRSTTVRNYQRKSVQTGVGESTAIENSCAAGGRAATTMFPYIWPLGDPALLMASKGSVNTYTEST